MFDTHVNLHGEKYAEDLDDVIERARENGVSRMLAICDRIDNFPAIHALTQRYDNMWCSVGVHPHYAKDFTSLQVSDLTTKCESSQVVAIGETGLDFHYGYSDEDSQLKSLRVHIEAARETGLPIILHTRNADKLMGDVLEEEYTKGAFRILLHCYTGGIELMQRGVALGAYVSASGIITFKNAHDVRDVISQVPIDRLVVETDCPYLAPPPHRGRRNEPSYLSLVVEKLAELHGTNVAEMAAITEKNATNLFSKVKA